MIELMFIRMRFRRCRRAGIGTYARLVRIFSPSLHLVRVRALNFILSAVRISRGERERRTVERATGDASRRDAPESGSWQIQFSGYARRRIFRRLRRSTRSV